MLEGPVAPEKTEMGLGVDGPTIAWRLGLAPATAPTKFAGISNDRADRLMVPLPVSTTFPPDSTRVMIASASQAAGRAWTAARHASRSNAPMDASIWRGVFDLVQIR
jgi:hypothetical protein